MKHRLGFKIIGFFIACLFFVCAFAQADILDYFQSSKEIQLVIGETKPLRVNNPRQVKIGNPKLLDVVGAARDELLLSGLKEGETILTIVDDFGQQSYAVKIYIEDLDKVKERVDVLLETAGFGQLTTKIGDKERKVFVIGEIPASKKDHFEDRIDSVKDKIINLVEYQVDIPSVQIDVEVLELSKTAMDDLGFSWDDKSTDVTVRPTDFVKSPSKAYQIIKYPFELKTWEVTLNFLKQRNEARTLSRPKIVCLSGKEAELVVGGARPYITSSTTSTTDAGVVTTYAYEQKDYGLTLSIKPTVKDNDEVQVSLTTAITEIDESVSITIAGNTVPGSTETSTQTELTVVSGQTVFLAGLMKSKMTDVRDGIAGLSSIPFLGALFRNKDYDKIDTEIVITLTPTIIRNQPNANSVQKATPQPVREIDVTKTQSSQIDDPAVNYSSLVQNIIYSNINYPQELRDENVEGTVKLSLNLAADGRLLGVIVMQSSGSQFLDEAAASSVRKLSPYPAFPVEVKLKELWIDVPIVYQAKNHT